MGELLASVPDGVWGAVAVALPALGVAWINQRGARRSEKPKTTSDFIDDLAKRITDLEARLTTTEAALDAERSARQKDREDHRRLVMDKDAYADVLLEHIRTGKGPPPPSYPVPPAPPRETA